MESNLRHVIFFFVLCGLCASFTQAELQWAWVSGPSTSNGISVTSGLTASPSARRDAVVWRDSASNTVYLFGGYGNGDTTSPGFLRDLWKYNESSASWVLLSGPTATGTTTTYPSLGMPSGGTPPRRRSAMGWIVPERQQLFLFGGYTDEGSGGQLNDLWAYQINTSTWFYIGGSSLQKQTGTYGTLGIPGPSNYPGAREQSGTFVENVNSQSYLYLFAGFGFGAQSAANARYLNDLWRYNVSDGRWTWLSGLQTVDSYGVYGTGASFFPGGREAPATWFVESRREFWIFGGSGYGYTNTSGIGDLNDVWKLNLTSLTWSFKAGYNISGAQCVNTTYRIASASNNPGARSDAVSWLDEARDEAWIGFGNGLDCSGLRGYLNDIWRISLVNSSWAFMSGSSQRGQPSSFGPLGQEGSAYFPGSRYATVSWHSPSSRHLYAHGGSSSAGLVSDVWRFSLATIGLGGTCLSNSQCSSNICSRSGHCCSTPCSSTCTQCSSGSCTASPDGANAACPTINCSVYLYGWSGAICSSYVGSVQGACASGACSAGSSACSAQSANITGRPTCSSIGCQKACPQGALANDYSRPIDTCWNPGDIGSCPLSNSTACSSSPPEPRNLFTCDSATSSWIIAGCGTVCVTNETIVLTGTTISVSKPTIVTGINATSSTIQIAVGPSVAGLGPVLKVQSCPSLSSPILVSISPSQQVFNNVTVFEYEECGPTANPPLPVFASTSWDECATGHSRSFRTSKNATTVSILLVFGLVDTSSAECSAPTTGGIIANAFPTGIVAGVISAVAIVAVIVVGIIVVFKYRARSKRDKQENAAQLYTTVEGSK
eukprot:TRINITY_DN3337_c0_g1_i1.p1 TRINITY_DN3337_c0_g1~~TRINITY_DN3337_c0_g1_i1.p1  ORF type:complete len:831 (+),score=17.29 TRINITY_DN3337_c0_g1_i1:222-2714(+)